MKKRHYAIGISIVTLICLNVLAWNSTTFCDYYVANIFPVITGLYGQITSFFTFSIGEVMIALAVVLLVVAVLLGIGAVFFLFRKNATHVKYMRFVKGYYRFIGVTAIVVSFVMTLNCYILYHCSTFEEKYWQGIVTHADDYTIEELAQLRDFVVTRVNQYAKMVERDENGLIIYEGNMEEEAIRAMQNLGREYPQLAGYYTTPKKIAASEFLSQQYMKGYYFPFSMEANYNEVMYVMSKPATMCHELAHTKGFIYEDEANLISFLACLHSDDIVFQYSGYLSVLTYIDNDFINSIEKNKDVYNSHVKISSQVKKDRVFLTEDAWEQVEKKAVVSTKTVKKASKAFTDTALKLNGIEQGSASYCEVVGLLMDYYMCSVDDRLQEEYMVVND